MKKALYPRERVKWLVTCASHECSIDRLNVTKKSRKRNFKLQEFGIFMVDEVAILVPAKIIIEGCLFIHHSLTTDELLLFEFIFTFYYQSSLEEQTSTKHNRATFEIE